MGGFFQQCDDPIPIVKYKFLHVKTPLTHEEMVLYCLDLHLASGGTNQDLRARIIEHCIVDDSEEYQQWYREQVGNTKEEGEDFFTGGTRGPASFSSLPQPRNFQEARARNYTVT